MMKGSKSNEKRKNFILFSVVFLTVFSLAIVLLYIDHRQSELRSSQTPLSSESGNLQTTPGGSSSPDVSGTEETGQTEPTKTPEIIIPGTDAPVYIGISSQIDVEATNNDYIATLIKDKLMQKNFYHASSGELDSISNFDEAFEINWFDDYVQIRIRASSEIVVGDLYKEFLNLVYDHGAYKYTLPAGVSPTPTPTPPKDNDKYSYLTVNIFQV